MDLSRDLDAEVLGEIRRALLGNLVVFFRGQSLAPDRQLAFARRWGDIRLHPYMRGMDDHPEVLEIRRTPADEENFGGSWHSDQTFTAQPAMGTVLYAEEAPSAGGGTLFTNQYLAYESLSGGMRRTPDPLKAVSRGDGFGSHDGKTRGEYCAGKIAMRVKDPGGAQVVTARPLVRTHPETGRKALYVGGHVFRLEGMTEAESRPLIGFLMRHPTRPEFTCRFRWRTGSVAFWDNRRTQHLAVDDHPAETRIMHRVTVRGDAPL